MNKFLKIFTRKLSSFFFSSRRLLISKSKVFFSEFLNENTIIGKNTILESRAFIKVTDGGHLSIGQNCNICSDVSIIVKGGEIIIGDHVFIGKGSVIVCNDSIVIGSDTQVAEYCTIRDQDHNMTVIPIRNAGMVTAPITIGTDCWLGAKVTVTKSIEIGDYSIVGANSVVTKNVPERTLFGGVPARKIKCRDL